MKQKSLKFDKNRPIKSISSKKYTILFSSQKVGPDFVEKRNPFFWRLFCFLPLFEVWNGALGKHEMPEGRKATKDFVLFATQTYPRHTYRSYEICFKNQFFFYVKYAKYQTYQGELIKTFFLINRKLDI